MNTGQESPQSVTIQYYYRGFSILLTKRDPEVKVAPLLEEAMKSIDWAIEHDLLPSWNQQTNKEVAQPKNTDPTWIETKTSNELGVCKKCGAPNALSKNNKVYCTARCWLK